MLIFFWQVFQQAPGSLLVKALLSKGSDHGMFTTFDVLRDAYFFFLCVMLLGFCEYSV